MFAKSLLLGLFQFSLLKHLSKHCQSIEPIIMEQTAGSLLKGSDVVMPKALL